MSNPTSNFGWQMPTATDLVTDLPADFEVFGQAVDTDFVDLLGGTTGQILSKTSATDLDFTWIANDQGDITGVTAGNGITVTSPTGPVPTVAINTAVTADLTTAQTLTNKTLTSPALTTPTISTATTNGDLLYGTGSGALARRGIGSTSQVLTVSGGLPVWATPATAASGLTLISRQTFTGVATTGTTFDGVFTSTYKVYLAIIETCFAATATDDFQLQLRYAGPTTQATDYLGASQQLTPAAAGPITGSNTATQMTLATNMGTSAAASGSGQISFGLVGNSSQSSTFWGQYVDKDGNYYDFGGKQDVGRTYTGFLLKSSSSNITGTVAVYGLAIA